MKEKKVSDVLRLAALTITVIICYMFIKGDIISEATNDMFKCYYQTVKGLDGETYYMYNDKIYDNEEVILDMVDPHRDLRDTLLKIGTFFLILQVPGHIISAIVSYAGIGITWIIRRVTDCITLVSVLALGLSLMLKPEPYIASLTVAKNQLLLVLALIIIDFVFVARGFRYANLNVLYEEN